MNITLSPLFNSLFTTPTKPNHYLTLAEDLLNNTFSYAGVGNFINKQCGGDVEEGLLYLSHFLEEHENRLIIISNITGEVLLEIPLTAQNLEKQISDFISADFLEINLEVKIYAR